MRIAVVAPTNLDRSSLPKRLKKFTSAETAKHASFLSNMGNHLDTANTEDQPAHLYAPLDSTVAKVFVLREFPVLYANDFTVCWLGKMVEDMGAGGELFIEIASEKANKKRNHVTTDFLRKKLPHARVERVEKNWFCMRHYSELDKDLASLQTIFDKFHNKFQVFCKVFSDYSAAEGKDAQALREDATRTYIYSLFGANQKGFVIERIIHDHFGNATIEGLDLGGGYGFMAAEVASAGHTMTMIDHKERNVDIGKWLAKECDIEDRLMLRVGDIVDVPRMEGQYDIVSYFGCLLYIERKHIPEVLRASMGLLKADGVLLIHENPKEAGKPGSLDYEKRFEVEELMQFIRENAGEPAFYNMFTGHQVGYNTVKNKLIMAAIRKNI